MNANTIARHAAHTMLLLFTCVALGALPGAAGADPDAQARPEPPAAGSVEWCQGYERQLLGLVNEITDSVLLNLRLAMQDAGAGAAQVARVLNIARHPVIASYVEQKHGRQVLGRYEALLDAVGCLHPTS